jgi:aldehyde:ferredoxin oxidoreductase
MDMIGVVNREIHNSSGLCYFGNGYMPAGTVMEMIKAVTGFNYSKADEIALGQRMHTMRHAFNLREGMRREDFKLSKRMVESEPPFDGPVSGIKVDHELLADNFFNVMGWNMDMVPLKEALLNLGGLEKVIEDLYPEGN